MSPSFRRIAVAALTVAAWSGVACTSLFDRTPVNVAARHFPGITGRLQSHVASADDTLIDLARHYDLGYVELIAANPGVDPWLPGRGTRLVIPSVHLLPDAAREGIVINLAEQRLYYFPRVAGGVESGDEPSPLTFPIGVSRVGWKTPLGKTNVVRKVESPIWYPTHSALREDPTLERAVGPGPENPLGTHALYLDWPRYLIHGTNEPDGVGRRVSRGCIRLYPEDIVDLFARVPIGTPVRVLQDPIKLARAGDHLFLEVHPSLEQADEIEEKGAVTLRAPRGLEKRVRRTAGELSRRIDWSLVQEVGRERRGIPIRITTR